MNLDNDHNVYILGAGFSRDAGMPLVSDFLERMRDAHPWLEEHGRQAEADAVARVLEFRLNATSSAYWTRIDLENIEELFSLASATDRSLEKDIRRAIAATLHYSLSVAPQKQIDHWCIPANHPMAGVKWLETKTAGSGGLQTFMHPYTWHVGRLLGMFIDGATKGRNTFISFNYDTILEDALVRLAIPFDYGLRTGRRLDSPATGAEGGSTTVSVFKMHGSVNWAFHKKQGERRQHFTVFGSYADVVSAGAVPELLPPTWNKTIEGTFTEIWDSAVQSLHSATRILIIGFSLPPTDMHFKYLMSAGLQGNLSLRKILFCNSGLKKHSLDDGVDPLMDRVLSLFHMQHSANKKILFEGLPLDDFVKSGKLTDWGRPMG